MGQPGKNTVCAGLIAQDYKTFLISYNLYTQVAFGLDLNLLGDEENVFNKAVMTVFSGIQYSTRNPLSKVRSFLSEKMDLECFPGGVFGCCSVSERYNPLTV